MATSSPGCCPSRSSPARRARAVLGARRGIAALVLDRRLAAHPGLRRAMAAVEWLRGHLLTGFPWNAFGYALTPTPVMMQSAALVGLWGLTLAAFVIFAAPGRSRSATPSRGRRQAVIFVAFAAVLLVAHLGYGAVRLADAERATVPMVRLRIVQPALEQSEKWQAANVDEIVQPLPDAERRRDLSRPARPRQHHHLDLARVGFSVLAHATGPRRSPAIGDTPSAGHDADHRRGRAPSPAPPATPCRRAFNSVFVIDDDGAITRRLRQGRIWSRSASTCPARCSSSGRPPPVDRACRKASRPARGGTP